jgi:LacI family transcriptional regulator
MFVEGFQERGRRVDVLELGPDAGIEDRIVQLSCAQQRMLTTTLRQLSGSAAIWCEDDSMARIVCDAARGLGLAVPADVAVLGLGDYRIARAGRPLISTIPQPGQLIGSRAVERIASILGKRADPSECVRVPCPPVLIRESTESFTLDETAYHRVLTMIRNHACEGLTVKDLVPSVPHSQRTFSRRFHEIYGRTPGAMIRQVRLERAIAHLRDTQLSIARIAELCGFQEAGKFCTFFKRETGVTPSAFRKSGARVAGAD